MKIAIFSFYSGLLDRGVETWAKNLKDKIGGDFEIEVIGGEEYGKAINWGRKNKLYWEWLVLRHFLKNAKKIGEADIVVPSNGSVQAFLCRAICFFWQKPVVIFGHAGMGRDDKWNLLCSPNVFVAFGTPQKRWAEKYKLPWTKVEMIPHAVDTNRFTPVRKRPRKKLVLCVAANIPSKRVYLVKRAVEKLKGYKVVAVGKGNPLEVSHNDIPKTYQKADVFCFVPWEREAFGLVFLEAMASNLPVVTIDDETRREIVGDAGIFVEKPESIKELAAAIKDAYETNWGNKPRIRAGKFSWTKISKEYEKLFNSLI